MRLFLLTALVMVAFAANSILNRLALAAGEIGPSSFALIRIASSATALAALVRLRERGRIGKPEISWISVCALALSALRRD